MAKLSPLTALLDRRFVAVISARARRQSIVLRLIPDWCLVPLLAPSAKRLRTQLVTVLLALSILIAGAGVWIALQ